MHSKIRLAHGRKAGDRFPIVTINVTNRCNLACKHCFIYRDANPNKKQSSRVELSSEIILATLESMRERHGTSLALWMGGEPLLRRNLLEQGVLLFYRNIITTNGTLPLVDFGPHVTYVISLDGPAPMNDAIRGKDVFARAMKTIGSLPSDFESVVQVQCTVTATNYRYLEKLVRELITTRVQWMTFSFYVPSRNENSELAWSDNVARMKAVREVLRLKEEFPAFVRNRKRALELMAPRTAKKITDNCLAKKLILPLYLDSESFTTPFCCYGDDVDCNRCGAWIVFELAARSGLSVDELSALAENESADIGTRK